MVRGVVLCALVVCIGAVLCANAALASSQTQLAALSGVLLNISNATEQDYTITCGPAKELLDITYASPVCIAQLPRQTIIGAVGSSATVASLLLDAINQSPYIGTTLIKSVQENACDGAFQTSIANGFTECPNALLSASPDGQVGYVGARFSVYAYQAPLSDDGQNTFFVLVTDKELPGAVKSKSFFSRLGDFFKGLFGWWT